MVPVNGYVDVLGYYKIGKVLTFYIVQRWKKQTSVHVSESLNVNADKLQKVWG